MKNLKLKTILALLLSGVIYATPTFAAPATPTKPSVRELVHYIAGNQITFTEISILSNGLVMQRNRTQATFAYQQSLSLDANQLKRLMFSIEQSVQDESKYSKAKDKFAFGDPHGELNIYANSNKSAYVKAISDELDENGYQTIVEKTSANAKFILDLVNSFAKNKL